MDGRIIHHERKCVCVLIGAVIEKMDVYVRGAYVTESRHSAEKTTPNCCRYWSISFHNMGRMERRMEAKRSKRMVEKVSLA